MSFKDWSAAQTAAGAKPMPETAKTKPAVDQPPAPTGKAPSGAEQTAKR